MSLIIATICPEGIVMAADSRGIVLRNSVDPETGKKSLKTMNFVTTLEKIFVTDNNVAIGLVGRDWIKGMKGLQYLKEYFDVRPGMNARQVAEEISLMLQEDEEIEEVAVLVAGMMPGRRICRTIHRQAQEQESRRYETTMKPWVFELTTRERNRVKKHNIPGALWFGEEDILLRLLGKDVVVKDGRRKEWLKNYVIPFELFSLQDAIEFSELGVELTARVMRFQERDQTVGGPIKVLTITRDGVKWVRGV